MATKIRALDARVSIFTVPFLRFNLIPIGGRSTAVKLDTGNVVLFASHSGEDEATRSALKEMHGSDKTVSHIVALDAVHQLYLSDYIKLYPQAKLVGPKALVAKRKDLKFDIVFPESPLDSDLTAEFDAVLMKGHPNEDIVFYHRPTKTLIEADVMFNLTDPEQASGFTVVPTFASNKLNPFSGFHKKVVAGFAKFDKPGFTHAAKQIAQLDFTRIIPCHGKVIDGADGKGTAKDAWNACFADLLRTSKS